MQHASVQSSHTSGHSLDLGTTFKPGETKMTRTAITAILCGVVLASAVNSASYACGNTNPAMPMMDDPMDIVASGSTGSGGCGPDPDPPKDVPPAMTSGQGGSSASEMHMNEAMKRYDRAQKARVE